VTIFSDAVSWFFEKNFTDFVVAVDAPSITIDKNFGVSGQAFTINQIIVVADNGFYREILNGVVATNYVTNPTLSGTSSNTPPTGYTVTTTGATINSSLYTMVANNVLNIEFDVTGSSGDEVYIDIPLQTIPTTVLPYVMSGILHWYGSRAPKSL
jgi:hypothetical protein